MLVGEADLGGRLALDTMDSVCLRTASMEWNVPGKYGPHGELFFFLIQNEPATVAGGETFSPFFKADIRLSCFSADVPKKCALVALHVMAEEGRYGMDFKSLSWGEEWKMGCQKSPMWESEGGAWSEDESVSSSGAREGNVGNDALHVIGLHGPDGKISLFLKDMALSCHMALDMLCQEMHEAWKLGDATERLAVTTVNAFSHRGRVVTAEERVVVRGNRSGKEVWQVFVV